jgi:serine/threonine protein kinase/tetratricopeptide (TPR) repeat protein
MGERDLFLEALSLDLPGRQALLERADAALRERVQSLLDAHEELHREAKPTHDGTQIVDGQVDSTPESLCDSSASISARGRIWPNQPSFFFEVGGKYRLQRRLGAGGMGEVWLAEQSAPVKRQVAVKLVKQGLDSVGVVARFEQERQALARMDHPNIAKVFDAGNAENGRPFFAMELVDGVPITEYCDREHLAPHQRLELFVPVCHAVQHAHQKGIVHRDLKPGNILVAMYDDRPVPKVIDFGVAKALHRDLTELPPHTAMGSVVGTLEYMAPEQAGSNRIDVDTRADVYSLGVVLYELLTGAPPFSARDLGDAAIVELLRVIREVEPTKPSTRLSGARDLPSIAANRQLEPKRLQSMLAGELDWIVMKALAKERDRRYDSPSGLALDVQRYLADETVSAGPPSAAYRLRKFVRRHRVAVAAGVAVAVAVVGGAVAAGVGMMRAVAAERRAVFESGEKDKALAAADRALRVERTARDKALAALRTLTDDFVSRQIARGSAVTEENRAFIRKVLLQYEELGAAIGNDADDRTIRAEGFFRVAFLRLRLGETRAAEAAYAQAISLFDGLRTEFPTAVDYRIELAQCQNNLGDLLRQAGRMSEAEAAHRSALAMRERLAAELPERPQFRQQAAQSRYNLGALLVDLGRQAEAEATIAAALESEKRLAVDYPTASEYRRSLARTHTLHGSLLRTLGRAVDAEADFAAAVSLQQKLVAEAPAEPEIRRELGHTYFKFALLLQDLGRKPAAEDALTAALALRRKLADEFPLRAEFRQDLANCHYELGSLRLGAYRLQEALAEYGAAESLQKRLVDEFPERHKYREELAMAQSGAGIALQRASRFPESEAALTSAVELHRNLVAADPKLPSRRNALGAACVNLAVLHLRRQKFADARHACDEAALHLRAALESNPRHPEYRAFFRANSTCLMPALAGLGDRAGAVQAAAALRDIGWEPSVDAHAAARGLCNCVVAVKIDEARRADAHAYAAEALGMLRTAVAKGYRNVAALEAEAELKPIRDTDDFRKLLAELRAR